MQASHFDAHTAHIRMKYSSIFTERFFCKGNYANEASHYFELTESQSVQSLHFTDLVTNTD